MFEYIRFENVGPAAKLNVTFNEKYNLVVGANGSGKTVVLDAIWWALTNTWAKSAIMPHMPPAEASIEYRYRSNEFTVAGQMIADYHISLFDRRSESWSGNNHRRITPDIIIYAFNHGGFSVSIKGKSCILKGPFYVYGGFGCQFEGMVRDLVSWKMEDGEKICKFKKILDHLSGLSLGDRCRVSLTDARWHPTIKIDGIGDVPITQVSSGIYHITALSYIMTWAWYEHMAMCAFAGENTYPSEVVIMIDDIDAHLYVEWKASILENLVKVSNMLSRRAQLIVSTNSLTVMMSAKKLLDVEDGRWFKYHKL